MIYKVMVVGYRGKMGALAERAIAKDSRFILSPGVGSKQDLTSEIQKHNPDIVLDFTCHTSVYENAVDILEQGKKAIIGSSGLKEDQINSIRQICDEKKVACFIIPNFSLAVTLMIESAKKLAGYLPEVSIIEYHHSEKKDAPSQTAIFSAQQISESRGKGKNKIPEISHLEYGIPVHSIRSNGFVADQDIIFAQKGESLTLKYSMHDRDAFIPGILLSCEKIIKTNKVVIGLDKVLSLFKD